MRLAGLLGLSSGEDTDRVRAVIARAALATGDVAAACDVLSAAVLRRQPRRGRGHGGGGGAGGGEGLKGRGVEGGEVGAFPVELCEVLDLIVEAACVVGAARSGGEGPRFRCFLSFFAGRGKAEVCVICVRLLPLLLLLLLLLLLFVVVVAVAVVSLSLSVLSVLVAFLFLLVLFCFA